MGFSTSWLVFSKGFIINNFSLNYSFNVRNIFSGPPQCHLPSPPPRNSRSLSWKIAQHGRKLHGRTPSKVVTLQNWPEVLLVFFFLQGGKPPKNAMCEETSARKKKTINGRLPLGWCTWNKLPSWELTYPLWTAFWRWFFFSPGGIC